MIRCEESSKFDGTCVQTACIVLYMETGLTVLLQAKLTRTNRISADLARISAKSNLFLLVTVSQYEVRLCSLKRNFN